MNNNSIKTTVEGNKITKVCVEDVYKLSNRMTEAVVKAYNNSIDIIDSVHREINGFEGEFILGTGTSQPCVTDAFDKEIGDAIAFSKAKLKANIKKYKWVMRVLCALLDSVQTIDEDVWKLSDYIKKDLAMIRMYNPEYLPNIEEELGV